MLAAVSAKSVVVLERLPRGGGSTRWFYVESSAALSSVLDLLVPASRVSFYFDDRIAEFELNAELTNIVARLLEQHGEIVVGTMPVNGVEIDVDFATSPHEVVEHLELAPSPYRVFVGAYPAADNDGVGAITALVPDADGSVRREPH